MAKYAGVDMSKWQVGVDYKALKNSKIKGKVVKFAMLRISYGMTKDVMFDEHYKGCKDAGIYVGVYHWTRATTTTEAKQEALELLERLKGYEIDYPIALDFEDEEILGKKLGKNAYSAIINTFMNTVKNANYYPILYIGKYVLAECVDEETQNKWDIWLAQYTPEGKQAQVGQKMWQFGVAGHPQWDCGNVGSVDGVDGQCDVNWSYVGYAAKIKKLGMNVPSKRYKITGTKTVTDKNFKQAEAQLKAFGFDVKAEVL